MLVAEPGDQIASKDVSHSASSRAQRRNKRNTKQKHWILAADQVFIYRLPCLLNPPVKAQSGPSKSALEEYASQLEKVLSDFSVNGYNF